MKTILTLLVIGTIFLLTVSFSQQSSAISKRLHQLFREEWEYNLKENPGFATYLGDSRYNDRLSDRSVENIERQYHHEIETMNRLKAIDRNELSVEDRLNYDLFEKQLGLKIEGYPYHSFLMPINQMDGVQIDFPNLVNITPFKTRKDYDNYLKRLSSFPILVDQIIELMKQGIREEILQPAIVLRTVPDQIRVQFESKIEKSPFYRPFTSMPESFPDSVKERYQKVGAGTIDKSVFSAYQKLYDFFVNEYLPDARKEIGARSLPNGEDYYQYRVRYYTTTGLTPEEIHEIGLKEVTRIRKEMDQTIKAAGFEGSFGEFLEFLRTDPQFYYSSPEELLNGYRIICKKADPELAGLFGRLPRTPYGVIHIPDYQAPASPTAYYYGPSADGKRPGYFWANTYRLETRPKYEMEALALHEAVPGHHLQIALAKELEGLPEFRQHGGFTAFVEGWGLYAESLGEEMGFYQDPYSKFGQLTYEMWRACRLVVDTGMHTMGWTRQQAIDFLKENTAKTEHDIIVEIDRYIAWPGQALAYKIGELKIKELRAMAEESLGDEFDIREFHDVVLGGGALPLDILEERVMAYIKKLNSPNLDFLD